MHFVLTSMGEILTPHPVDPKIMGTAEVKIRRNQEDKMTALYSTIYSKWFVRTNFSCMD